MTLEGKTHAIGRPRSPRRCRGLTLRGREKGAAGQRPVAGIWESQRGAKSHALGGARQDSPPARLRHRAHRLRDRTPVFLLETLPPWHSNRLSRLVKTPKLYLGDTGVACRLGACAVEARSSRIPGFRGQVEGRGGAIRGASVLACPGRDVRSRAVWGFVLSLRSVFSPIRSLEHHLAVHPAQVCRQTRQIPFARHFREAA